MSNLELSLYVENKRVSLYPDENINLNQAVQSLKDLTKVFTDFTRSFNIPANDVNNSIFKHYYDAQIINGFDARVKVDARIEIGGITLKKGKLQLNGASLKSNVATMYSVEFFGDTIKIKDLIGEDKLKDLDLSAYNHNYDATTILSGISENSAILNGDIKYPLLSYKRRYVFEDTQLDNENDINVKYDDAFTSGIDWQELKPAIKVNAIRLAIQEQYELTFSEDFFSRDEFTKLYMTLGNGENVGKTLSPKLIINYNETTVRDQGDFPQFKIEMQAVTNVSGSLSSYRVVFEVNGERVFQSPFFVGNSSVRYDSDFEFNYGNYDYGYFIEAQSNLDVSTRCLFSVEKDFNGPDVIRDQTFTASVPSPKVQITNIIGDLKIVDWFAGIVKAFNLVIVPLEDGTLYVNDLQSWYDSGQIRDISQYVDIESLNIDRGKLYREINFGYEEQESLLANQYESQFAQQFGGFENKLLGLSSDETLEIILPFENPQFERISDEVQYGFIVDKDLDPYENKPFLIYIFLKTLNQDNLLGFSGDTYFSFNKVNTPTHAINLVDGFSAQFNAEFNEFNGAILSDNFYSRGYDDYFNDLFSTQRRQFTLNANLPITLSSDLQLNDRLVFGGNRYLIDNIDTNLLTGVSKLVLLNDIFTSLRDFSTSRLSPNSGSFVTGGDSFYIGGNNVNATTNQSWIAISNPTLSSGENLQFTLQENNTGSSRVGLITVNDELSNPTLIITQN